MAAQTTVDMLRGAMTRFRTLIAGSPGNTGTEKARNYFAQYDGDSDGLLQRAEVEHLMRVAGTPDPANWAGEWLKLVGRPDGVPVSFMASTIGRAIDDPALVDKAAAQLDDAIARSTGTSNLAMAAVIGLGLVGVMMLWSR